MRKVCALTEEARKELIEDNKEHPYTYLQKPIYGEHEKAEHDKEIFEEMEEAITEAGEGIQRKPGKPRRELQFI